MASADPLRRFPFVIAALVVTVVAAFLLLGGAPRDPMGITVAPNPVPTQEIVPAERVPATPSRGAMGQAR